ncbi:hypothetical protein [uncultured Parabacteroides sp.]|uniref:hypothetical protein n=1 Tax=uncultured Parabacteroides sp. TaxID=512312 RepID=UPI0026062668|nr:hypothetical protein [uncultured Parabacteroides sp.]
MGKLLFVTKTTVPTWEDYFSFQKCLSQVGTATFIRSVNTLIAETRTARNQRGSKKKGEGGGAGDERPGEL